MSKKKLYMSKNLQELNQFTVYSYDKNKSIKNQIEFGNRAFTAASLAHRDNDEERAYVLYMKYLDCLAKIRRTYAYRKDEPVYKQMYKVAELCDAMDKAESLSASLEFRYCENKVTTTPKTITTSDSDSSTGLNGHQNDKAITVVENKDSEFDKLTGSINIHELYKFCYQKNKSLIVMDIRSESDYLASHINHNSSINVPQETIQPGFVCKKIEAGLPKSTRLVWDVRDEVDLVVLMDWYSNIERLKTLSDPLKSLKDSLWKWEQSKKLKREPLILEEGYAEFLEMYPQFTTDSKVNPPSNKPKTSNVNSLLDFSYDDLRKTVNKTNEKPLVITRPTSQSHVAVNSKTSTELQTKVTPVEVEPEVPNINVDNTNSASKHVISIGSTSSTNKPTIDRSMKPKPTKGLIDSSYLQINSKHLTPVLKERRTSMDVDIIGSETMKAKEATKTLDKEIEELERKTRLVELQWAKEEEEERLKMKKKAEKELADKMRSLKKNVATDPKPTEKQSDIKPTDVLTLDVEEKDIKASKDEVVEKASDVSVSSTSTLSNDISETTDSTDSGMNTAYTIKGKETGFSSRLGGHASPAKSTDINALRSKKPLHIIGNTKNVTGTSLVAVPDDHKYSALERRKQSGFQKNNKMDEKSSSSLSHGRDYDSSSTSLKRSFSSPNVAKLVDKENVNLIPQVPSRSKKPVIRDDSSDFIINLTRSLDGVYGRMGRALCGLRNLGNSCYMNSILQCMFGTVELVEYILTNMYRKDLNRHNVLGQGGRFAECFSVLLRAVWNGQYKYLVPKDFKYWIGKVNSTFADYSQEDAQELLMALIDGLHEDINRSSKTNNPVEEENDNLNDDQAAELALKNHKLKNDSLVHDLFMGQFKATVQCLSCKKLSKKFDIFLNLSLSMPQRSATLYELLQEFERPEKMTGSNRWHCPRCNTLRDAVKTIKIWKLPPILIVHFKRFVFSGMWREKIHTTINFPITGLNMEEYVCGPHKKQYYNLYAVSHHQGAGLDSGHYVASCKSVIDKNWYRFDDTEVSQCSTPSGSTCFVLFYSCFKRTEPRQESMTSNSSIGGSR